MKIEKVKEIIDRKSSIPEENESFEMIEAAYNMASKIIDKAIPRTVKAKGCWNCEKEECVSPCKNAHEQCPTCGYILDNEDDVKYNFCPNCSQALTY